MAGLPRTSFSLSLPSASLCCFRRLHTIPNPPNPPPRIISRVSLQVVRSVYCGDRYLTLPVCFGENDADSCPPPRIRYV